jgi:uncharacterized protein YbjT (DUF2867 family)
MKILVTGSTGTVGSEVVRQLHRRGAQVRALVHRRGAAQELPPEVETVAGDLLDPVSVEQALQGMDKMFLLNAVTPDELTQALIACNLARRLRARHVVQLSVFQADRFRDVPHFASKLAVEGALREFGPPFTILRPGYYFQNDARLKEALAGGLYPVPLGPTGIAAADARDIAEAAAIALTGEGHEGKTYNVVGPNLLSGPGAAATWSGFLGREVRYAGEDFDRYERQLREHLLTWAAFDLRKMFQSYRERGFTSSADDVAGITRLLGRPPRTYEAFARETAEGWKKGEGERGR